VVIGHARIAEIHSDEGSQGAGPTNSGDSSAFADRDDETSICGNGGRNDMRRSVQVLFVVAAIALSASAATARAGLIPHLLGGNCGTTATVFSPWGDSAGYYFASNGGFESGSTGWSLSGGAGVASGSEPWSLSGSGSHSLVIPKGGSAAINVCYGLTYPAVRFVVKGNGAPATVHVRVISRSLLGILSILDGGTFTTGTTWAPSPKLSTLFSALAAPLGAKSMQLQFTVESGSASIDDLFVDPFLSKS
jgi:hypothetical protein